MKEKIISCVGMVVLALIVAAVVLAQEETVMVKGTVYAAGKDENGEVSSVVIDGPEEAYAVSGDASGGALLDLVNKEVEAAGTVSKDAFGNKVLTVTSYHVSN